MRTEERVVVGQVQGLPIGSGGAGGVGGDYYPFFGTRFAADQAWWKAL